MPNYNTTLQTNNSSLEDIITQLNNLPDAGAGGLDTSDATATSDDLLSGKTAYAKGKKITGTIATKSASNLTVNGATVTIPAGYYSTQATKSVSAATQATPTISVNSSTGLITATATQTAGYVTAGTKSATSQLAFKAATTITPGTTNQTAVAANTYVGGAITVKGDANLVASNIKKGVSIFGVAGTHEGGGGGGGELPEGYVRCDYIQFSGNQWVDTGIIGNQDTQIHALFTWENSTQRHLFGCASSDNTKSITSYMNGSWRFGTKYVTKSIGQKNPYLPYSALVNKTTISITNSVGNISDVADFETVGTLLLGGCRDSDGTQPSVGITGKVFYFYLWQGEEQVRKLIPVTDGNGTYRFFDMVTKTFFDSITSNPLTGGNL